MRNTTRDGLERYRISIYNTIEADIKAYIESKTQRCRQTETDKETESGQTQQERQRQWQRFRQIDREKVSRDRDKRWVKQRQEEADPNRLTESEQGLYREGKKTGKERYMNTQKEERMQKAQIHRQISRDRQWLAYTTTEARCHEKIIWTILITNIVTRDSRR